jgi:acetamidase/formamidase
LVTHQLEAGRNTVHWGYFDADLPPVLTINSGDTVTISTVSGAREVMPSSPLTIPDALREVQQHVPNKLPGHMCTGPVAVRNAKAGQVLQVQIDKIDLHYNWGYVGVSPLKGALPNDFYERRLIHVPLDSTRMVGHLPWGMDIPLHPFFGVMAVAPPKPWGMVSTLPPRINGGNLDNKELVAGTVLYLPIHIDGANFSVGDGHAVQGDGEVCVNAIETGLIGTFTLHVRDDMTLHWPMAETKTHMITMGFDPDLSECMRVALRSMLDLIEARTGLDRSEAYMLASLAADLRVTQVVNGSNGIHCMMPKTMLVQRTR